MNKPAIPETTRTAQARASDPAVSAWVSANAGSGKTHVLAQRVIRLLLEGVPPAKILCLTFTKAAAANMALRVFDTLAGWTGLEDENLSAAIAAMTGTVPGPSLLVTARCLFARTVETPGGLKIQTIHAFCERLLHLFPFEANVAAGFEVLEDGLRQEELLETARAEAFASAAGGRAPDLAKAVEDLAEETPDGGFDGLIREVVGRRALLRTLDRHYAGNDYAAALEGRFDLQPGEDVAAIERAMLDDGFPQTGWPVVAEKLGAHDPKPQLTAGRLMAAVNAAAGKTLTAYLHVFLTKELAPRTDTYLVKALRKARPDLCAAMDRERDRLAGLVERRRAARSVRRTLALLAVGRVVVANYARLKARRGLLDYDDLIDKTEALLTRSDTAWVLYKLDGGIDHVLIDEAQDTAPRQWAIIEKLTEEFTAGRGAHPARRTVFAVGDEKQSIFSFQGAAPRMFEAMRGHFARKARAAAPDGAPPLHYVPLHMSFRSAPAVLRAVDDVFAAPARFKGLSFDANQTKTVHESWKVRLPGSVEIWDTIAAVEAEEPEDWRLPLDARTENVPAVLLARRIALAVKTWTAPGAPDRVHDADGRPRPVRAGDVLILVQVRNTFFNAMTRALKEAGVPVAGPDRMGLTDHIAVMDLVAAGRAALLREDDLALACVLKSPLIGLDDDDLIALAAERPGTLAEALDADPRYQEAAARLRGWRHFAPGAVPFAFFMRILATEGGRQKMLARLGPEADDAIDEFLALALDHEHDGAPSLSRFLATIAVTDIQIKRDMEAAGDRVRVMTVHAAKGLEAKIVVLGDTCTVPDARKSAKLVVVEPRDAAEGTPSFLAWSGKAEDDPEPIRAAKESKQEDALDEYRRLLYVALTRAEERLVIAGFEGKPKKDGTPSRSPESWYALVRSALEDGMAEVPAPWSAEDGILWRGDKPSASASQEPRPKQADALKIPDWLRRAAPAEAVPPPPLRPSSALHAADDPVRPPAPIANRNARATGRCLHALLQYLPAVPGDRRQAAALRYLAMQADSIPPGEAPRIVQAALGVIEAPGLGVLFAPDALAEVRIAGTLDRADGTRVAVSGQIDRMGMDRDEIVIAEFKTGRAPSGAFAPLAYLAQIAVYHALVARLYPSHRIRALLVWTATANTMTIDEDTLRAALAATLA